MTADDTEALQFHLPPENAGQVVLVSYAMADDGEHVVMRVRDQSDRTTEYYVSRMLASDQGDYWNGGPKNKRWRKLTARERVRWGL